jgi:hypothetical protein
VAETLPNEEALAPAPGGSAWGRKVARAYLVIAGLAAALMVRELVAGASGIGTMAISILTAPWSVLLASLARALAPALAPGVMRALGLTLVVLSALLNARILYGMAARGERDARAARRSGGPPNG